ncbi:MFS transporter [Streptomyces sp. NPDC050095]|uniref:MFS transporter n=1 Tax=unclassified Streptomyces TaxID=2593676 RepID=UPI0034266B1E
MSRSRTVPAAPDTGHRAAAEFLAPYRALMRLPGAWRMAAIGMASKLAASMSGLSLLLLVSNSFSYATAGWAVSCSTLGQGLTAPLRGRLVDRCRVRPVLLGCLSVHLTATAFLLATVREGGGVTLVCSLAAAVGASAPPVAVMMRSIWRGVTTSTTLSTAMALDASLMGAALIVGPVLAGWLSLSWSPLLPYAAITAMTTVTVALVMVNFRTPPDPSAPTGHWSGPLASAPLRRLLAADALFVMTVTAMDVLLPIYARQVHAVGLTGLCLGALAVGSVLGSFALGSVAQRLSRGRELPFLLGVFAFGATALAVAARISPVAVLAVCPVAGLVIGALFAALRTAGGDLAPTGQVTETMSWLNTLDMAGAAAGAAVFAPLANAAGSRAAFALVPVLIVATAAISRHVHDHPRH